MADYISAMPIQPPAIARVVVNLSLDREFDYRIPERLRGQVHAGTRVVVPFGHSERVAYVVGLAADSTVHGLKEILRLENEKERIPEKLITLAQWMADYYCCPRELAVRAMLPAVVRKGTMKAKQQTQVVLKPEQHLGEVVPALEKKAKKQAAVVHALVRLGGRCELRRLLREADAAEAAVDALVEKGIALLEREDVDRDPFAADTVLPSSALELTPEQKAALESVTAAMQAREPKTFLLHGVTGSGKTEVYLQAIDHGLKAGLDAIVLVPEIALTPQTTERFRSRFGETVSVLHSGLSDGERFDEWRRINEGRSRVVVGARSALFAPVRRLGLIIVDEEHETTYKQDEAPRYNARDVAVVRAQMEKAVVILGTATPSLESAHNCKVGKYVLLTLPKRVDNQVMPVMQVVDMRQEAMERGQPQIFSRTLELLIRERLERGEQVIIFLNRRGYASQMLCTKCGYVAKCPDCDTAYTYHKQAAQLVCHLCGRVLPAPAACPACQDPKIRYAGLGTEKVEAVCRKLFPRAAVARMDSDTMTTRDCYRKALNEFRAGRTNILIGTQMIAKGLHFPNVTLVGVIYADSSLHLPDFRAGERTFQLLVQVAGRAGRGDVPGHVVVQTYTPFHPVLQHALLQEYAPFMEEELETRRALSFPPSTHMVLLLFRGPKDDALYAAAKEFAEKVRPLLGPETFMVEPGPAPIPKARGLYRYQISMRGGNIVKLTRLLRPLVGNANAALRPKEMEVTVDVDPYSLM